MSKAEKRALEAFPLKIDGDSRGSYDLNVVKRIIYQQGYEQAEKDLELTWEDMVLFRTLFDATDAHIRLGSIKIQPMTKEYYQEVLKRFNKERKEK